MKKFKEKKPKECIGCNSYRDYSYYARCSLLTFVPVPSGMFSLSIFASRFCPCKECIVKPTCINKTSIQPAHRIKYKCPKLKRPVEEFKDYIKVNKLNKTTIKRKKTPRSS